VIAVARDLKRMPSTFDFAEGATFLAGHGTAYYGLVDRARIKPGETLLVHGAAGGVGLAAVELGKAYGAKVIAVASSEEKRAVARARGADHVLVSGEPFRDKVKELTDGKGADVVFDPVGGKVFEESVRCINWGARLIIVGFLQGVGQVQTNHVLIKNASVLGIRAGEAVRRDPTLGPPRQRDLLRLAEEGRISPNVSHRLPLERWAEAMRLLIDRKAIGRVALVMD
jgi:NADPH2:quinone reductase